MASLQANHSPRCALARAWTPFDQAKEGCTCPDGPFYYVVVRIGEHAHKEAVGRDRQQAEIALHRMAAAIEDGAYRPRPTIGFVDWGDRWLSSLERKPSTIGSYRSTIAHAKEAFGSQRVRRIGAEDIARFNEILRERGCSPSTRAKHLRVLGACLQAAVFYRYADTNAVRELPPAQRPRPDRKEAAYFENDELPRLFAHLRSEPFRTLCLVALKTGMRQGVSSRQPSCSGVTSTRRWLPLTSDRWDPRKRSGHFTASGTHSQSGPSKTAPRSPGSHGILVTLHSR
jgi:Phage integrase SAM-like domain